MSDHRHLMALLSLRGLGPRRLVRLLDAFGSPDAVWDALRSATGAAPGRVDLGLRADTHAALVTDWRGAAATIDVDALPGLHADLGIDVIDPGHPDWPGDLADDPEPPPLLFCRGDRSVLDGPTVAIVGTRRCTSLGRSVARELGRDLAAAGVTVISGLALGIDAEAHRGALAAEGPVAGVVATGLDVPYPRRHRELWAEVGSAGLLLSEYPAGTAAERWRFPARNRIMAALADIVVVVESPATGGSMRTVESALDRQTLVMAVPGPVRSPASDGTNQLLSEGCPVVRDATDVLVALGSAAPSARSGPVADAEDDEAEDDEAGGDPVADAISWPPVTLEHLAGVTGLPFDELAGRLVQLELAGVVEQVGAGYQRRSS